MADKLLYKEVISSLLSESGGLAFERFNGDIALQSLDVPSLAPTRAIVNSDIITNDKGVAVWNYGFTSMRNLITRVDLKYEKVNPEDDYYGSVKFCNRFGSSDTTKHNFLSEGSLYGGYLETAYNLLGEERAVTIEASHIRDEATAEALVKLYILWRFKPLALLNMSCTYSVIDIEPLDKLLVTATVIVTGKTFLSNREWMVIGRGLLPSINQEPKINLNLIEIGGSNVDAAEDWIDTYATGDEKIDGSTGENIVEVL